MSRPAFIKNGERIHVQLKLAPTRYARIMAMLPPAAHARARLVFDKRRELQAELDQIHERGNARPTAQQIARELRTDGHHVTVQDVKAALVQLEHISFVETQRRRARQRRELPLNR